MSLACLLDDGDPDALVLAGGPATAMAALDDGRWARPARASAQGGGGLGGYSLGAMGAATRTMALRRASRVGAQVMLRRGQVQPAHAAGNTRACLRCVPATPHA